MDNTNLVPSYRNLLTDIGQLLQQVRQQVAYAVNTTMLTTYWTIGQYIVEFEQQGITNQLFVAKYQLYLPSREELQSKLYEILNRQSE